MALIRILMIALLFQTVVFASLWFFARARRKERLEAEWAQSDKSRSQAAFVDQGSADYDKALLKKLVIAVYVVPSTALALLIYLTSSS